MTKKAAAKRVSETSGVSSAALLKRLERKPKSPRAVHGNRLLSKGQEDTLMGILLAFSGSNCGLKPYHVKKAVKGAFGIKMHLSTARRVVKRNKHLLKERRAKRLTSGRNSSKSIEDTALFCDAVEEAMNYFPYKKHMVVNYDETRVCATDTDAVVYERCDKQRANLRGDRNNSLCSLLTFICADGSVLLTVYIFPGKPTDDDEESRRTYARWTGTFSVAYILFFMLLRRQVSPIRSCSQPLWRDFATSGRNATLAYVRGCLVTNWQAIRAPTQSSSVSNE